MTPRLLFSRVCKKFGTVAGLEGVSFTAGSGEIVGVLGPNGSGKSTLLMLAAGLIRADEGMVRVDGFDVGMRSPEKMRELGMLFDDAGHWDQLSAWNNAFFFARSYGVPETTVNARLQELFSAFDLTERCADPVVTLSYGMRRKLAVIEALAHGPNLILLDEPSIGLDFSSRMVLHARLREMARDGATVVFATNDVYEAQSLADRVMIFSRGTVVASGKPGDLIQGLHALTTIELRLASPVSPGVLHRIDGVETVRVLEDTPGRYRLRVLARDETQEQGASDLIARVATGVIGAGGILLGIECTEPNLGDVMAGSGGGTDAP